jgi:hypothetical protein
MLASWCEPFATGGWRSWSCGNMNRLAIESQFWMVRQLKYKMKTLKLLFLMTIFTGGAAGQGVILSTGDIWTYEFTNLDYVSTQSGATLFGASFGFTYSNQTQPGQIANLTYECFEGVAPDGFLGSGTQPIGGMGILLPANAWQDLEGSVRFTVTDGSFLIDSLTFTVWRPNAIDPSSFDTYQATVTPTPEPNPWALLVSGCFLLLLFGRKHPITDPADCSFPWFLSKPEEAFHKIAETSVRMRSRNQERNLARRPSGRPVFVPYHSDPLSHPAFGGEGVR